MNTVLLCFCVGVAAFFIGLALGSALAGYLAYREGVEDQKEHRYDHAHSWYHHKEEFE